MVECFSLLMNHEYYINRCIELAKKATGNTYPNPLVGSVIVHNGKIIGEGYHKKAGEAHAEINAINAVKDKDLLKKSTIYVSLEPCSHYGRTPPCADRISEIGFKKVVVGTLDLTEKVNGKGINKIIQAGLLVEARVLEKECQELNKRFNCFHRNKRPYIILKWAESADGFIDKNYQPTQISNTLTHQWVHQLRSEEHSILIGTKTALADNPSLTTRAIYGRNPIRILIDFDLKVPKDFNIFNPEAETLIFNSTLDKKEGHLEYIKIDKENFYEKLMSILYQKNIQSVLVEGGRFTLQNFIDHGLWDEGIRIKNPNLILAQGTKAPELAREPENTLTFRDNQIEYYKNTHHV